MDSRIAAWTLGAATFDLRLPRVRGDLKLYPSALERGQRSERVRKRSLAEVYSNGASTRKGTKVMEKRCGTEVSSSHVSRATALLDDELEKWQYAPLGKAAIRDSRCPRIGEDPSGGAVRSCAGLIAIGVTAEGKWSILGTPVSL